MGIGLLKNTNNELFQNNGDKIIYKLIHHNFIALLKTISIINGKLYVNWINIVPITMSKLRYSDIYISTMSYHMVNNTKRNYNISCLDNDEIYNRNPLAQME
jgi:hypothetical protein